MNCFEESTTTYFGNYNIIENYFVTKDKDIDMFVTLYELGELLISRRFTEKNELLYNIILTTQCLNCRIYKGIDINMSKYIDNLNRCIDMAGLSNDEICKLYPKINNYLMKK
jgi:hypothetical protein